MEAQSFLSNPKISLIRITQKPFRIVSTCCRLSYRTNRSVSSHTLFAAASLVCRNSVEKVHSIGVGEKDTSSAVKRKNFGSFRIWRGSNFWSIHEAYLGGSVNGDVVVLVTNKGGKSLSYVGRLSELLLFLVLMSRRNGRRSFTLHQFVMIEQFHEQTAEVWTICRSFLFILVQMWTIPLHFGNYALVSN